jgi:tryptophan-rich sensory protein
VERAAAALMAPYLAWLCYAGWLNAGIWWLNRG